MLKHAFFLSILFLLAIGCAHSPTTSPTSKPVQQTSGRVIEFPRQTLHFQPTRDDITVGCAVFTLSSTDPIRLKDGAVGPAYRAIHLKQLAKNEFELPATRIEFGIDAPNAIICMSIKVWCNEVCNVYDSPLYEPQHVDDRYALVSWCSGPADPSLAHRFTQNRVASLEQFRQRLVQPFVIHLQTQPLKPEWGYPEIQNGGNLSAAELKAIEKLARDRGEQFVLGISVRDADHADVIISVGDATRFGGMRVYKIVRKDGT